MASIFIPENEFGIEPRAYSLNEFCGLLRRFQCEPEVITFLADMLEE